MDVDSVVSTFKYKLHIMTKYLVLEHNCITPYIFKGNFLTHFGKLSSIIYKKIMYYIKLDLYQNNKVGLQFKN